MQPIGDYLKKLLYQYDCIVVPTLGAFLTRTVSASFSEATGQFFPPRRKVAFNEALMLDDGILLNYIMLHEGLTRQQALQGVHHFVTTLKQEARQMGSFSLEGLGLFSYNSENSLQFDPELRHNFLSNTYGMQPVMLANRIVHLATPMAMSTAQPSSVVTLPVVQLRRSLVIGAEQTSALSPVINAEEGQVLSMPVRQKGIAWRWAAAALLVSSIGLVSYFSVINPGDPFQSSLNPASLFRFPAFLTKKVTEAKLAPVVKPVASKPTRVLVTETKVVPVNVPALASDGVPTGEPAVPLTVATRKLVAKRSNVPDWLVDVGSEAKSNFTLIAGSFASRSNAIRFQKRLVRAGYQDAFILRGRGLIKVAAIGTKSVAEAEAGVDSLRSLTGITPWIMRNPK